MSPAEKPRRQLAGPTGLLLAFRRFGSPILLGFLPLALLVFATAKAIHQNDLGVDFRSELYPEAKLVLHGRNPFPAANADLSGGVNRIFPVPAALLAVPLTVFPAKVAAAVFDIVLLAALGATLAAIGVRDWRVYGAVALWPPTIAALQTGNLTILLGLLVALAWRWRDHRLLPGIAIGLAIALKLFLWPLVIWLLAIRRYSAAAAAVALSALGTLLVLPFTSLRSYGHLMSNLGNTFGAHSYNLVGLLQQSGLAGHSVAHLVVDVAGIAILLVVFRERSFPLAVAAALLLSPIVWMHYLLLLAVPLALARSAFAAAWLVPLVLWVCPGNGAAVRLRHIVIALLVIATVTAVAERGARRSRPARPGTTEPARSEH